MDMTISQRKNLRPYPCFQGHIKIKTANLGQNYLNADYLQIGSADFSLIRVYMYMTNLIFKVTLENEAAKFKPKILKYTLSLQWVSGFFPNLHDFKIWTWQYAVKGFRTLTLFSRSH